MTTRRDLLRKIELAFPFVEMPPSWSLISNLATQRAGGAELLHELEEYRGRPIDSELLRSIHQDLHSLSAEGWSWILPHYLRFCMSEAGLDSRAELEFLIYKLDPQPDFHQETVTNLRLLTKRQIKCLIDIVRWCMRDEWFSEYFPEDLQGAMRFLNGIYRSK